MISFNCNINSMIDTNFEIIDVHFSNANKILFIYDWDNLNCFFH